MHTKFMFENFYFFRNEVALCLWEIYCDDGRSFCLRLVQCSAQWLFL